MVIVYRDDVLDSPKDAINTLNKIGGISPRNVLSASDFDNAAIDPASAESAEALYLPALGIAVVSAEQANSQAMMSAAADGSSNILAIEPEYIYHALPATLQLDYVRGYRDAANHLYDELIGANGVAEGIEAAGRISGYGAVHVGSASNAGRHQQFQRRLRPRRRIGHRFRLQSP